MARRTRPLVLAVLVLVLAACSGGDDALTTDAAEAPRDAPAMAQGEEGGLGFAADEDTATGDGDVAPLPPATAASARSGDRLIKEGTMVVEVPVDGFDRAFERVVAAARGLGGSVVASTSSSTEDGGTAGSVTLRVPVDRYEDLLTGAGAVGEVRRRDITTQDVTAEFTDLESRLRHARAQERFYLGLLEEAAGVSDAIAVQQQLEGIQSTIEQLQGRRTLLDDRTSFSTLTVELLEPGAAPVLAAGGARPTLAAYAELARDAFVTVVGWILVAAVAMAPIIVPIAAGAGLWRALGRRPEPATVAVEP
jgi:hypothetical protein